MNHARIFTLNSLLRRSCLLASVALLLATSPSAFGQGGEHPRTNIGIGPVSGGYGSGPGPGQYQVVIEVHSAQRFAVFADDGGHKEWYCSIADRLSTGCGAWPGSSCGKAKLGKRCGDYWIGMDGVKLRVDSVRNDSGPLAAVKSASTLEGPLEVQGSTTKWEWPSEGSLNALNFSAPVERSLRTTRRRARILYTRFDNIHWNGSPIRAKTRVRWFESDPVGANDMSEWAYFNTGDMITRCLQGGAQGSPRTLLSQWSSAYWHLCSEEGLCIEDLDAIGLGFFGLHYNIAVYYDVSCRWYRKSTPTCNYPCCTSHSGCFSDEICAGGSCVPI